MAALDPLLKPTIELVKWLLIVGGTELLDRVTNFYEQISDASDVDPTPTWRRVQLNMVLPDENEMTCSFDLLNYTSGAWDSSWTTDDYEAVEQSFIDWWASLRVSMPETLHWRNSKYYRMAFNPLSSPKPFADSGPPERVHTWGAVSGTGTNSALPPQVAVAMIERTALPRHWGRFYLPAPDIGSLAADGKLNTATAVSWRQATADFYSDLISKDFVPVVPLTRFDKARVNALQGVGFIRTDNSFDTHRSRKAEPTATGSADVLNP